MATKPVISNMTPWDATQEKVINFTYSGNLPVSNRATVYDASTLEVVYDVTQITPSFTHTIPANTLRITRLEPNGNGHKYAIEIRVTDSNGTESPVSDKAYFWCLATPTFAYSFPTENANIDTPTVYFKVVYSQANGEELYSYKHYLYDNTKNEIASSDMNYTLDNLEYSFKGLTNHTSYYLRTVGVTKNGIEVDTGMRHVFINYENTGSYAIMNAESDLNATVTGYTNIICIDATESADDYIFLNSCVQIMDKKVTYETNFKINRDFTMQLKLTRLWYNGRICYMTNGTNHIEITSYVFDDETVRYCMKANNGLTDYVLYSDALNVTNLDFVVITLRRIGNFFSFNATKVTN